MPLVPLVRHIAHKASLTVKTASAEIRIIVDESPDVTGNPSGNVLFSYYDADDSAKSNQ